MNRIRNVPAGAASAAISDWDFAKYRSRLKPLLPDAYGGRC